jgi:hypothetical protein
MQQDKEHIGPKNRRLAAVLCRLTCTVLNDRRYIELGLVRLAFVTQKVCAADETAASDYEWAFTVSHGATIDRYPPLGKKPRGLKSVGLSKRISLKPACHVQFALINAVAMT